MIPVEEALARVLALATPVGSETVALDEATGRVLAAPVIAARDQPPFDSSAMDGYALADAAARPGARLRLVGQAAAGHGHVGQVPPGGAVRIFTGAPLPPGTDRVVIQEEVTQAGGEITLGPALSAERFVRPRGADFAAGARIDPGRRLRPVDLALIAAMNMPHVTVARRPKVAVIATGDELVAPGGRPRPDQIVASNGHALKAMVESEGGQAQLLPIARDTPESLRQTLTAARGADVIVTTGGASVGDHDLVAPVLSAMGMACDFHKVAMRPGKPLMAGQLGGALVLGLPGNPVSAIVCGHVFLLPALRVMMGLATPEPRPLRARLGVALGREGPRRHFMRATLEHVATDPPRITPFASQDSARLWLMSQAQALLIRPPHAPPAAPDDEVDYLPL